MGTWEERALEIAYDLPDRGEHPRLLVGACWHGRGFGFTNHLARALKPDLIVCLGDLSGLWKPIEACWIQVAWDTPPGIPILFVPGNHDSAYACRVMAFKGAHVLESPRILELGGVRVWGYRDPNVTRWGRKDPYSPALNREAAAANPPPIDSPYLAAVHAASMLPTRPIPRLVLCGHTHVQEVVQRGHTTFAWCGTAGGGGLNWPGKVTSRQAMVVDVKLPEHTAAGIWMIESDGKAVSVTEILKKKEPPEGGSQGQTYPGRIGPDQPTYGD